MWLEDLILIYPLKVFKIFKQVILYNDNPNLCG